MPFGNVAAERAALEWTYDGLCTVSEFKPVKDPKNGAMRQQSVVVLENQPCALSQSSLPAAYKTDTDNALDYDAKLFISSDVTIKAGSNIRVVQDGMDYEFEQTGEPFRYPTHQEIKLKRKARA
ncbi:hypothetical protein GCM10023310_00870 [Paenibacillus vulneris]|uniref:Head-to-tail stopper n=1 Tax=Paenibacillus vulneris TaxID=1133364 RepID=A0ABW3UZ45_9BACL